MMEIDWFVVGMLGTLTLLVVYGVYTYDCPQCKECEVPICEECQIEKEYEFIMTPHQLDFKKLSEDVAGFSITCNLFNGTLQITDDSVFCNNVSTGNKIADSMNYIRVYSEDYYKKPTVATALETYNISYF